MIELASLSSYTYAVILHHKRILLILFDMATSSHKYLKSSLLDTRGIEVNIEDSQFPGER